MDVDMDMDMDIGGMQCYGVAGNVTGMSRMCAVCVVSVILLIKEAEAEAASASVSHFILLINAWCQLFYPVVDIRCRCRCRCI